MLGRLDDDGKKLIDKLIFCKKQIIENYENLNFAAVVRTVVSLADEANRYVEQAQPWVTIKSDTEKTRATLTSVVNTVRILAIYLKPILPKYAQKIEKCLNVAQLNFADVETLIENHRINNFERLFNRIDKAQVNKMVEQSKENHELNQKSQIADYDSVEPFKPQCLIEDFDKIDLRIAKVIKAELVEGADKLLRLQLDLGNVRKSVLAAIAKAYKPDELTDKIVVCLVNLKPRKMKFGVSEGMILATGTGGKDIFVLSADNGAKLGQKVS